MNKRNQKNMIIGGLLAIVLVMAVGYAAFANQLNIAGTSTISTSWDVEITNIEVLAKSSGASDNEGSPTYDNTNGLTASFNTNLASPGDYATYKIEVTNKGSLNAVLSSITGPTSNNDDIEFYLNKNQENKDITDTDRMIGANDILNASGDSNNLDKGYVYVTVLYKDYDNQTSPSGDAATATATVTLNFSQSNEEATASGSGGGTPASTLTIDQTFVPQYYRYGTDYDFLARGNSLTGRSDITTDPTTLSKNYYLGYDVDASNNITETYACFVLNNTQYCMKAASADGTIYHTENTTLLGTLKDAETITCTKFPPTDSNPDCSGGGLGFLFSNSDGTARVGVSYSVLCTADYTGVSYCIG